MHWSENLVINDPFCRRDYNLCSLVRHVGTLRQCDHGSFTKDALQESSGMLLKCDHWFRVDPYILTGVKTIEHICVSLQNWIYIPPGNKPLCLVQRLPPESLQKHECRWDVMCWPLMKTCDSHRIFAVKKSIDQKTYLNNQYNYLLRNLVVCKSLLLV